MGWEGLRWVGRAWDGLGGLEMGWEGLGWVGRA